MVYANDKISDLYNKANTKGDVGLELEVEGKNLPINFLSNYWRSEPDGSLRYGGVEYIHTNPIPIDKVSESLDEWIDNLQRKGSVLYDSERTSVHSHMNVQNKTLNEVITGCISYYILENVLMKYAGPSRETNLFCLPLKQSKNQIKALDNLSKGLVISTNQFKYSALNLTAIGKYGSVEQRGMRGYYDCDFLDEWVKNLYNIFEQAPKHFKNPVEAFDYFYGRQFKDYLGLYFTGPFIDKLTSLKDWELDKNSNMNVLGSFVYNWDHSTTRPKNDRIKVKKKPPETGEINLEPRGNANLDRQAELYRQYLFQL